MDKRKKPENRRKRGVLRGGVSPDVGKATRFMPGVSGNPNGRPKSIDPLLREIAETIDETDIAKRTFGLKLAQAIFDRAIRKSDTLALGLVDRLDGKIPNTVANADEEPFQIIYQVEKD